MSQKMFVRALLAVGLMVAGVSAQAAIVQYKLSHITFETTSVPGTEFPFGSGALAASSCDTCGISLASLDDVTGDIVLSDAQYTLAGFGANFTNTFAGTTILGLGVDLDRTTDSCVVNNTATQWCDAADPRGYSGDWNTGFLADGTTVSSLANLDAVLSGSDLVLSVSKARDNPEGTAYLTTNFYYTVVPVPAAVWLFASALGLLGWAKRKTTA